VRRFRGRVAGLLMQPPTRSIALLLVAAACAGCVSTKPPPGGRLSASEQLLAAGAVDRALASVEWPDVYKRRVFVDVASPANDPERLYLQNAVAAQLVERGAILAHDAAKADLEMLVVADAVGVEESSAFFGIPSVQAAILPVATPEIALYSATENVGYAKLKAVLTDLKHGGVTARCGPAEGMAMYKRKTVLMITTRSSDEPEVEKLEK
jgi:hypothetical protein